MARQAGYDRTKVLQKALNLFWNKGYNGTSLKDLEAALDMRPGSIYAAFGSKEALYGEALRLYAEQSKAQFQAEVDNAPSRIAGLAAFIRSLGCVQDVAAPSRACMLVKTLLETPDDDPVLRRQTEDLMRQTEMAFAQVYRDARDAGEISTTVDPDRLASRLQAEIFGLRAYSQRTDSGPRVTALADDIAQDIEALSLRS